MRTDSGCCERTLAVAGDDGHRLEAAGAVGLQPHLLVGEGRHLGEGDGLHRAAGEAVEAPVDVHLDLAGKAGEGLDLQHVVVLRLVVDDADRPQVELLVAVDDLPAGQPRRLVHGAQVRPPAVLAPVLVEELSQLEGLLAELKRRHVLRHRSPPPMPSGRWRIRGRWERQGRAAPALVHAFDGCAGEGSLVVVRASRLHGVGRRASGPLDRYAGRRPTPQ